MNWDWTATWEWTDASIAAFTAALVWLAWVQIQTTRRLERPWLIIEPEFPRTLERNQFPTVPWTLLNGGRSPAFVSVRNVILEEFKDALPEEPPYPPPKPPLRELVVAPDAHIKGQAALLTGSLRWARLARGQSKIIFFGRVIYRDVFRGRILRRSYEHAFCYEFIPLDPREADDPRDPEKVQMILGSWEPSGPPGWTKNT